MVTRAATGGRGRRKWPLETQAMVWMSGEQAPGPVLDVGFEVCRAVVVGFQVPLSGLLGAPLASQKLSQAEGAPARGAVRIWRRAVPRGPARGRSASEQRRHGRFHVGGALFRAHARRTHAVPTPGDVHRNATRVCDDGAGPGRTGLAGTSRDGRCRSTAAAPRVRKPRPRPRHTSPARAQCCARASRSGRVDERRARRVNRSSTEFSATNSALSSLREAGQAAHARAGRLGPRRRVCPGRRRQQRQRLRGNRGRGGVPRARTMLRPFAPRSASRNRCR